MNSMGATIDDVVTEYNVLWVQTIVYWTLACLVYRHQLRLSRQHVHERLDIMKRKLVVRRLLHKRKKA